MKKKTIALMSILFAGVTVVFFSFLFSKSEKVKYITIEAGSVIPSAEDFFINPESNGRFVTDMSAIDTKKTGNIPIELETDGEILKAFLIIQDTTPPKAVPSVQYIFKDSEINAADFVSDIDDTANVTCSFASAPDLNQTGRQDITVLLTDESGNVSEVNSGIYVLDIKDEFTAETGTADNISAEDFITNYDEADTELSLEYADGTDFLKPGSYPVTVKSGRYETLSVLKIVDSVPPSAEPAEKYIFRNSEVKAGDLVYNVDDTSDVEYSFVSPPDLTLTGWQDIAVTLTDSGGNSAEILSRIYIFDTADELTVEMRTLKELKPEDFIKNYIEADGLSIVQSGEVDFSTVGDYPVTLKSGDYSAEVIVKVRDTTPPQADPLELYIFKGNILEPQELVTAVTDAAKVSCEFSAEPDFNRTGWQETAVKLTDESGNITEIGVKFYVFDYLSELNLEAGTLKTLNNQHFITNYDGAGKNVSLNIGGKDNINLSSAGIYPVTLQSGKYSVKSSVNITDNTPPSATVKNSWTYIGKPIQAKDFAENITDASPVSVKYKDTPDFSKAGETNVNIILEDAHKNITEYPAVLNVVNDVTPPVITGAIDKWVVVGGTAAYRAGVTVSDDYDSNVQLFIDSKDVNLNKPGSYTIIYSSSDESGNKTEVKGTVTVRAVDIDLVNDMADEILAQITDSGMSKYNKAKAIFNWVHAKMKYSAGNNTRNLAQGAYNCFSKGSGDCYTYMAASQVLLTRAGISNQMIRRDSDNPSHFWNLVDTGTGWHHFDVCPTPGNAVTINQRFLFTESQAQNYTKTINTSYGYYSYDKSSVPEVVE